MDKLLKLYVKTLLMSEGINCKGMSFKEMLGVSTHLGEPAVDFDEWCEGMSIPAPEPVPEVTEDDIEDEINSELNRCMFAAAMGSKNLQEDGILSIKKVS